jgi:hypothetical protein
MRGVRGAKIGSSRVDCRAPGMNQGSLSSCCDYPTSVGGPGLGHIGSWATFPMNALSKGHIVKGMHRQGTHCPRAA